MWIIIIVMSIIIVILVISLLGCVWGINKLNNILIDQATTNVELANQLLESQTDMDAILEIQQQMSDGWVEAQDAYLRALATPMSNALTDHAVDATEVIDGFLGALSEFQSDYDDDEDDWLS